ncbi:Histone-lysine N-methyltransferase TRX1 [Senna tora]|uniref:Enhancer of polycomb-like protein n=1 Tax=Senna tora TaxID=362788 RepID=A0A834U0T2_9FABA|nr:Histone-lysine N-methyltransferase TRX1 [Senna tora]
MEGRAEISHGPPIPKKSRTLDLNSLYKSKETKEIPKKNLKRKGSSPRGVDEKRNKKRKSRKEVSLRSLENADGSGKKTVDEEFPGGPSSGRQDLHELKLGARQRLSGSIGLNRVSLSLDDEAVHIPKRKRDFVGRKKSEVGQAPILASKTGGKSGCGDQMTNLSNDELDRRAESSKNNQKKDLDEFKENRSSDSNSVQHFKGNEDSACHSVVNSSASSLKKSRKKGRRKQNVLDSNNTSLLKEAKPLINSSKISNELREDDEENLEENAARMLSSRFDPSCTGFSSSSKSSTLPSANGLSFSPPSGPNLVRHRSNTLSSAKSSSADSDTAGRVLRPRNQHKEKGHRRKRRHFYEIFLGDLDAYWVLNRRIKVFWPLDQSWYFGLINDYDKEKKLHHIKYDDRDEEWIDLQTERFKLLLLPSEVPESSGGKGAVMRCRSSNEQRGSKSRKETRRRPLVTEDDSCVGSCMDSEPLISWLARTSNRVKSSFHAIKKQKTSVTALNSASSLLYDEAAGVQGCLAKSSCRGDESNMSNDSLLQHELGDSYREKSSLRSASCPKGGKLPIVYFRRRFRRPTPMSPISEEKQVNSPGCSYLIPVLGAVGEVKEPDDRRLEFDGPLRFTCNAGVLKICFLDMESSAFKFDLKFPARLVMNDSFESHDMWLLHVALLLQYGTLVVKWPRVLLEMLFVDNVVGLRLLLFEGCLKMAASFVSLVLRVFNQPADKGLYVDLQLPVTSIRFKFSCLHDIKKQLVFAFYNFSKVKNSKWMYLDSKLKSYCLLSKQLHISECTYDNIRALQNGSNEFSITSSSGEPSPCKVMQKKTRHGINIMGVPKESTQVGTSLFSDAGKRKLPPFALSFAAAPTFFLSLHLKLLMERSVAHISFCNHMPVDDMENSGMIIDGCTSLDNYCNSNLEINMKENMILSKDASAKSKLLSGPSACGQGVLPQNNQNICLSSAGTSDSHGSERLTTIQLPKGQPHTSMLEHCPLPSSSLIGKDKAGNVSRSFLGDLSIHISSVDHIEKPMEGDFHDAQHSSDVSWDINGCVIPSPNPTAPRSAWHRNRSSFSSFGLQSHGWLEGKSDSLQNGFSNGPKKPRTQVSYSLPFPGYDFNSKHRSHSQKPHKRIRRANEKKLSDVARAPKKNFESLTCDANVLITLGEKGWRESGAQVVLELYDHNEWKLSVKLSGITRYSYKAHQFLQPGSTNRYTHAMMWKGGKDWVLEFTDRSQWALFKEMHEECYNRNIRAASVKNIPIPGVRLIEENDENGTEVTFVRSSKYFRQVETDVEMALDSLRVLYDMDSEDEQWLSDVRNSEKDNSDWEGISDETIEKTMDMFEKSAYTQQRDEFSPHEIEELMADIRSSGVIKTIYEHWQQRRRKKGMALIRHFQPPLWERYQQQLREWEVAMTKNSIPSPNGCLDKVATLEKPPMFAFCLKPRGLEVMNKGSKQRSQKKISVSGQTHSFLGDQDGFHTFGRRLNGFAFGDEKLTFPGHNYDSLDDSPLPQTSPRVFSPSGAGSCSMAYYTTSNDGFDRNNTPKFRRSRSKKSGSFMYHNDSQMMASFNRRMSGKKNGVSMWNMGYYELASQGEYLLDVPQSHEIEQLDGSDLDEFRLRDASGAAQHARNMAKLKRERAQRLFYRADLAIHKAVVALMTAEAMKASESSNGDG